MKLGAATVAAILVVGIDGFAPVSNNIKNHQPLNTGTAGSNVVIRMSVEEPKNGSKRKAALKVS